MASDVRAGTVGAGVGPASDRAGPGDGLDRRGGARRLGTVTLANRHANDARGGPRDGAGLEGPPPAWTPGRGRRPGAARGRDAELELDIAGRRMAARLGAGERRRWRGDRPHRHHRRPPAPPGCSPGPTWRTRWHAIEPADAAAAGRQHLQRVGENGPRNWPACSRHRRADPGRNRPAGRDRAGVLRFAAPVPGEPRWQGTRCVREAAALYRMAPGIAVEIEAAPGYGSARREELVEVLVNLLDNARNAGGTVRLRASRRTPGDRRRRPGRRAGAPGADLRAQVLTTSSGAGLGLAVVRRLVESWGRRCRCTVPRAPAPPSGSGSWHRDQRSRGCRVVF
jgi:hypothetical protein